MTLPSEMEQAIHTCFDTWGLQVDGEITAEETEVGYVASVPFSGELLYEEALQDGHGNLLYNKEAEIQLHGLRDGQLLLLVK